MDSKAKALFFAQYLNQKVYQHDDWKEFNDKSCKELDPTYLQTGSNRLNGGYLVLRGVDKLTDDECRIVYQLRDIEMSEGGSRDDFSYIKHEITLWCKYGNLDYLNYQHLLRTGILLPFTYLDENNKPITLSPTEIIALGWAKINS